MHETPDFNLHRREFVGAAAAMIAAEFGLIEPAQAQAGEANQANQPAAAGASASFGALKQIDAPVLNVGYAELGPAGGPPVLLLHGWPYELCGGRSHPRLRRIRMFGDDLTMLFGRQIADMALRLEKNEKIRLREMEELY